MMKKEELIEVKGGINISASLINAFTRGVNTLYNLGVAFGSALRISKRCEIISSSQSRTILAS